MDTVTAKQRVVQKFRHSVVEALLTEVATFDLAAAQELLAPVVKETTAVGLIAKSGMAKLSVVGIGMRSHSGVASRMFQCLGKAGINIQLISTSEIKIAVVIEESDVERAAQLIHEEFGLASLTPVASAVRPLV